MPARPPHLFLLLLLALAASPLAPRLCSQDRDESRLQRRGERIAQSLSEIQADPRSQIPPGIMREAQGLIILKQFEAGVIFGAKGGFGLALQRSANGQWGPPAWIRTGEISGGLQLGAQRLNAVLVVMKQDGLSMLNKAKFEIGIDATITRGPTGSNYEANVREDADILVYTNYEGYYAGATFEGSVILPDRRANQTMYGQQLEVSEILEHPDLTTPIFLDEAIRLLAQMEQDPAADSDQPIEPDSPLQAP